MPLRLSTRVLLAGAAVIGTVIDVGASAPLKVINRLVPDDTYRSERDIAYGEMARQRLDVYMPVVPTAGAGAPIVIFFYGGGWHSGARANYLFAGEAFASRGYVTVLPDYRLHPQVRYPDFLLDCARAVAWVARNAARFGGDARRIYLVGHSAGGYNAAMLAYAPEYLAREGVDAAAIRAFVGLAGPYDFIPLTGVTTRAVFGFPDTSPVTQPIFHVRNDGRRLPPALLLTAPDDTVVKPGNSERMATRLRGAGTTAKEIAYADLGHESLVGALAAPLRGLGPVREDIVAFIVANP